MKLIQRRVIELEPKNQTDQCLYAEIQYELGFGSTKESISCPGAKKRLAKRLSINKEPMNWERTTICKKDLKSTGENLLLQLMDMAFPKNPFQK